VGTYRGRWAGVSGYIEENVDKQAIIEINEETSLTEKDLTLIKKGEPVVVFDRQINRKWVNCARIKKSLGESQVIWSQGISSFTRAEN